jgi:hypothetical protein
MPIGAISEAASSSNLWNPAQSVSRSAPVAFSAMGQQSAPAVAASPDAPVSGQAQSLAASAEVATIAASYSTPVGGKSYAASVEESGGVFTASVPMPPGLRASGGSIESAEINLSIILDTLA